MIYKKRKESDLQISVANWIRLQYPKTLWTISPSGMKLGKRVAGRFKAMGYLAGTPDIIIFEPRGNYHGLFIEIKMPGGKPSLGQDLFCIEALKRNYVAWICPKGFTSEDDCFNWAINRIKEYMELPPK